jgi:branched-chain amino acid transport system substrate-binding protein
MKGKLNLLLIAILILAAVSSCVKRQEIPLYEEKGDVIPAADSLYSTATHLYKESKYEEAVDQLKLIIEKHPTSEKVDDALSLILLSKYKLKDYKGALASVEGKESLYKGRAAESDILYIVAQSLEKLHEDYRAAEKYIEIMGLPDKSSIKKKSEERLKKIIEKKLSFGQLTKLSSKYDTSEIGVFLLYTAAKKGYDQGKEKDALKILGRMEELYPNDKLTSDIRKIIKGDIIPVKLGKRIGFLGPLTGQYSIFGKRVKKGLELALKGNNFKIIERDTKGNPIETIQKVIDLIKKEDVFVIIGPVLSMPMIAASGISNLLKIPIISPTATEEDIASIGPYVFQLNVGLGAQAREMAKYAAGTLGYYKIAILCPDDAYGNSLAEIFSEEAAKHGVQIVAKQNYPEGTTDFKNQMKFIKDRKPQAVYIPCYPNEAVMIAPQLKYYRVKAKILGADGWNDESVPRQGEDYVEGAIFTGNPAGVYLHTKEYKSFRKLYYSQYKVEPSRESALGYDAGMLLLKSMSEDPEDTEALTKNLRGVKEFVGASGVVNPQGVFEGSVPLYKIKNGEIIRLK